MKLRALTVGLSVAASLGIAAPAASAEAPVPPEFSYSFSVKKLCDVEVDKKEHTFTGVCDYEGKGITAHAEFDGSYDKTSAEMQGTANATVPKLGDVKSQYTGEFDRKTGKYATAGTASSKYGTVKFTCEGTVDEKTGNGEGTCEYSKG